ncbi:hypothetical protein V8P87_00235 [Acinetobacter baumannii]
MKDLEKLHDFVNKVHNELGRYRIEFCLSPDLILKDDFNINTLAWDSISYGEDEIENIPDNKRGIYAFAICHNSHALFPTHGYILYIGIAGRKSQRSIRDRYKDYLNIKKIMKRPHIANMIGNWEKVLRFFYAPIDDIITSEELEELERKLNVALLPPFSKGDLEAEIKQMRGAFNG